MVDKHTHTDTPLDTNGTDDLASEVSTSEEHVSFFARLHHRPVASLIATLLVLAIVLLGTLAYGFWSNRFAEFFSPPHTYSALLTKYELDYDPATGTFTETSRTLAHAEFAFIRVLDDSTEETIGIYATDLSGQILVRIPAEDDDGNDVGGTYIFREIQPPYGFQADPRRPSPDYPVELGGILGFLTVFAQAYNVSMESNLLVSKEIQNADGVPLTQEQLDQEFHYTLIFDRAPFVNPPTTTTTPLTIAIDGLAEVPLDYWEVLDISGNPVVPASYEATFTLQHGQEALINGLAVGTGYRVIERMVTGYTPLATNDTGTIAVPSANTVPGDPREIGTAAQFTNEWWLGFGNLSVSKEVVLPDGSTPNDFFQVQVLFPDLAPETLATLTYSLYIGGVLTGPPLPYPFDPNDPTGPSTGVITISHDQTIVFDSVIAGTPFTVTELLPAVGASSGITYQPNIETAIGNIQPSTPATSTPWPFPTWPPNTAPIGSTVDIQNFDASVTGPGAIIISKIVQREGDDPAVGIDEDDSFFDFEFEFTIEFFAADGSPADPNDLTGLGWQISHDAGETFTAMTTPPTIESDGTTTVSLTTRDAILITNLPLGMAYRVTEADYTPQGFYVNHSSVEATVAPLTPEMVDELRVPRLSFFNYLVPEFARENRLTVTKVIAGNPPPVEYDRQFHFTVTVVTPTNDPDFINDRDGRPFNVDTRTFTLRAGETWEYPGDPSMNPLFGPNSWVTVVEDGWIENGQFRPGNVFELGYLQSSTTTLDNGVTDPDVRALDVQVTNTYIGAIFDIITGEKTWNITPGFPHTLPPFITVLLRGPNNSVVDMIDVYPDSNGNWLYEFDSVLIGSDPDNPITYTVDELSIPGFEMERTRDGSDPATPFTNEFSPDLVNTAVLSVAVVRFPVVKELIGSDLPATPPTFTFQLRTTRARNPMPGGATGTSMTISAVQTHSRMSGIEDSGSADVFEPRLDFTYRFDPRTGTGTSIPLVFENAGRFEYVVTESPNVPFGYVYDTREYIVTFEVARDANDILQVSDVTTTVRLPGQDMVFPAPFNPSGTMSEIRFTNSYRAAPAPVSPEPVRPDPATGDATNLWLWIILLILGSLALTLGISRHKKTKESM
ncbi:MAG: DUF5979 domain-containing protein [Coriobacteriia bacterium]|nr:DUF5979 domain-containing protein [Coriobacteriia bacterium]